MTLIFVMLGAFILVYILQDFIRRHSTIISIIGVVLVAQTWVLPPVALIGLLMLASAFLSGRISRN